MDSSPIRRHLISFDIDGTLETGDPPGPLTTAFVRYGRSLGWIIGSASDRTLREQTDMWARAQIEVDFVSNKHTLHKVRETFPSDRFIHIGDTQIDAHFAELAGFDFWFVLDLAERLANHTDEHIRTHGVTAEFRKTSPARFPRPFGMNVPIDELEWLVTVQATTSWL